MRKRRATKRSILPDPIYKSEVVAKLINTIMLDGKKGTAQTIVYQAFDTVKEKTGKEAFFNDDRLPYNISDFISKPATKKNIDIKNSFINICIENSFTMYMSFNI